MTYYADLSEYVYLRGDEHRPGTVNVGWLDGAHPIDVAPPTEELLDALWAYCRVSVAQTRGLHLCELCPPGTPPNIDERNGERLLLGSSEIRVFDDGAIYAAPTLIYHYVAAHQYRPSPAFVAALLRGPAPPDPAYFQKLEALALQWNRTSSPRESGPLRPVVLRKK